MTNSAQSESAGSFLRTVMHFTVIDSALRAHFNSNRARTPRTSRDREPRIHTNSVDALFAAEIVLKSDYDAKNRVLHANWPEPRTAMYT